MPMVVEEVEEEVTEEICFCRLSSPCCSLCLYIDLATTRLSHSSWHSRYWQRRRRDRWSRLALTVLPEVLAEMVGEVGRQEVVARVVKASFDRLSSPCCSLCLYIDLATTRLPHSNWDYRSWRRRRPDRWSRLAMIPLCTL